MKMLWMMRWAGLAAAVGGMFMTFSDLMNLTVHVPGLREASHTGYQAVGSGVILLALTLLFVGIVGLFARSARTDGPKVLEYGDARARYVLVGSEELRPAGPGMAHQDRRRAHRPAASQDSAAWNHRTGRGG